MYCKSCGRVLKDHAKFCTYCGVKIGADDPPYPDQRYQQGLSIDPPYPDQRYWEDPLPDYGQYDEYGQYEECEEYGQSVPGGRRYSSPPPRAMYGAGMAAQMTGRAARGGARAARTALSLKLLAIIAAALIAIVSILYVAFLKSGKPEDTVAKLEKALNNLDQDELLECFDSQSQDLYNGALSVGGSLMGVDLSSLAQLANGLGGIVSGMDLVPKFTLTVTDTDYIDRETCMVTVDITQSFQGQSDTEPQQLPMKKVGRKWLITMSLADFG